MTASTLLFSTKMADVHLINHKFAQPLQQYLVANKQRLAPFEPARDADYFTLDSIKNRIDAMLDDYQQQRGISMLITLLDSCQVIGSVNFTGFMYGVFQAGYLGFSIDKDFEGQGIMRAVLTDALQYVHAQYGLHRIMANHLPDNNQSARLLKRLGFEKEGYAKSYLKINGQWRDHVLNSIVFEDSI
ncbi:GNAT family N-acetyltransferase [Psychrobacter sp. FDAARGOS_221]|uniref:GNAT family N-acetyltransferase n=1 Tax=Psychrobacter sp. FDAARGOS_221 TaxID=1975705 RepID=UPI000BB5305E|nr:GNAT family N-acetyltransferase [Psychrobacter sp. FDAARGOS_221]PNK60653.1 GNAT family N-acetyltransferase [Psychrobacter sp. FDAARGOS_221]